MKRGIAGVATTVLVAGGVSLTGVSAGVAQAHPDGCTSYACWCPGQPLPGKVAGDWDMTTCHDWHYSWHDDPHAPQGQIEQGPLDCGYGPGTLPQCAG